MYIHTIMRACDAPPFFSPYVSCAHDGHLMCVRYIGRKDCSCGRGRRGRRRGRRRQWVDGEAKVEKEGAAVGQGPEGEGCGRQEEESGGGEKGRTSSSRRRRSISHAEEEEQQQEGVERRASTTPTLIDRSIHPSIPQQQQRRQQQQRQQQQRQQKQRPCT